MFEAIKNLFGAKAVVTATEEVVVARVGGKGYQHHWASLVPMAVVADLSSISAAATSAHKAEETLAASKASFEDAVVAAKEAEARNQADGASIRSQARMEAAWSKEVRAGAAVAEATAACKAAWLEFYKLER